MFSLVATTTAAAAAPVPPTPIAPKVANARASEVALTAMPPLPSATSAIGLSIDADVVAWKRGETAATATAAPWPSPADNASAVEVWIPAARTVRLPLVRMLPPVMLAVVVALKPSLTTGAASARLPAAIAPAKVTPSVVELALTLTPSAEFAAAPRSPTVTSASLTAAVVVPPISLTTAVTAAPTPSAATAPVTAIVREAWVDDASTLRPRTVDVASLVVTIPVRSVFLNRSRPSNCGRLVFGSRSPLRWPAMPLPPPAIVRLDAWPLVPVSLAEAPPPTVSTTTDAPIARPWALSDSAPAPTSTVESRVASTATEPLLTMLA